VLGVPQVSELYDHELERNVLSVISNVSALDVAKARELVESSALRKESFHLEPHRFLFEAIQTVLRKGFPVDPFTVEPELKKMETLVANDREFITNALISQPHISDSSLPAYSKTLNELCVRRNLFTILGDARAKVADKKFDPGELLAEIGAQLEGFDAGASKIVTMGKLMDGMADHLDMVQEGKIEPIIPTGIAPLDHVIGGLQPTLMLVGALPGVGKSALISTITRNIALNGSRVGVISLEDEASWLPWRILSRESSVDQFILRFRKLSNFQKECTAEGYTAANKYAENIVMADGSDHPMEIDRVVQTATQMVTKYGCKAIIVDHLGEIAQKGTGDRYDLEVSAHISRLRGIANRFGVPVVVALHLRRREGLGLGTKPNITDFANSSGAERKARVALALSRAEGGETLQIHILKNTLGKGTGMSVEVPFHGASAMLEEAEAKPYEVRRKREVSDSPDDSDKRKGAVRQEVSNQNGAGQGRAEGDDGGVDKDVWPGGRIRPAPSDVLSVQDKLPWDE
jgi:replicative DNA helicase